MDPLAEWYKHLTPYNYGENNPILMMDPDGMAADSTNKPNPPDKQGGVLATVVIVGQRVLPAVEAGAGTVGAGFAISGWLGWRQGPTVAKHWDGWMAGLGAILVKMGVDPKVIYAPNMRPGFHLRAETTIEDLKDGGKEVKVKNQKDNVQWEKDGGFAHANQEFDNHATPGSVETKPNGTRVGSLPDGSKIAVYEKSSGGKPTVVVQKGDGTTFKVRYN